MATCTEGKNSIFLLITKWNYLNIALEQMYLHVGIITQLNAVISSIFLAAYKNSALFCGL